MAVVSQENNDFQFPLNSSEWENFLIQFMKHIHERYGKDVVRKWRFEFSFAPYVDKESLDQLIMHYKKTYEVIRRYNQLVEIGGPGFQSQNNEASANSVLNYLYKRRVCFDFITYKVFPTKQKHEDRLEQIEDENFLEKNVFEIKKVIQNSGYQSKKLIISEWSNTLSNRNLINDSLYKGCYTIKNLLSITEEVDAIAYWIGSDLFERRIDSSGVLHGGAGLITKDKIPKPVFNSFILLNFLHESILYQGDNLIATTNKEEKLINLLAFNFTPPSIQYYLSKENNINMLDFKKWFSNLSKKNLAIKFVLVPNKTYKIKMFRVNEKHGNIMFQWEELGYQKPLMNKELEYLERFSQPKVTYSQRKSSENGELEFNEEIMPNEFVYISLSQVHE